ncbi:MAG: hypoxanthine phosphoribosyltransferase [Gammaproteobacteria bacterium]|nr:hypoxanthine phosphoribosyltransferase [Gammaproteobacteria bacterium]
MSTTPASSTSDHGSPARHYIREADLLQDAFRLGVQIYNSGFRPTFIVGLWRGGSSVGIAVQECLQYLGVETDHISIRTSYRGISSYQQMLDNPEREIRVHGTQYLLEQLNDDDQLLIVDDVFSSGLNVSVVLNRLQKRLKRNMPSEVKIAVPWYKPSRKQTDRAPDYYVHETADWLVMPYELSGLSVEELREHKSYLHDILLEIGLPETGTT